MPEPLVRALEIGELVESQLRELIRLEAAEIGMSYEDAVRAARDGSLPNNAVGSGLELLAAILK